MSFAVSWQRAVPGTNARSSEASITEDRALKSIEVSFSQEVLIIPKHKVSAREAQNSRKKACKKSWSSFSLGGTG
jgi:hypothetical protein